MQLSVKDLERCLILAERFVVAVERIQVSLQIIDECLSSATMGEALGGLASLSNLQVTASVTVDE